MKSETFLPGSTIGMLGGGQLGRMFAMAAHAMGYHVIVFDSRAGSPAAMVADDGVVADFNDRDALLKFAGRCDLVTLEWENIPTATVEAIETVCPVHPSARVLRIAQDRKREKGTLAGYGLPVTPFAAVENWDDASNAAEALGLPLVLKTSRSGYDGKGQRRVDDTATLRAAFEELGGSGMIAEQWIRYRRELSVIIARSSHGEMRTYPLLENHHKNHILDMSLCPAPDESRLRGSAEQIARVAAESLGVIGLLCVELFETEDGSLLINEIAPRPHNSGHLTIEASITSQFEQQVRAICGLPLGETTLHRPAAMVNLMGELWEDHQPDCASALRIPESHLHLYGKLEARTGRKMGHITALADTLEEAMQRASLARAAFE
jgi:5-(carboxyamino)imidazole ribonucleotide synthase